jgi:hypothetical protein
MQGVIDVLHPFRFTTWSMIQKITYVTAKKTTIQRKYSIQSCHRHGGGSRNSILAVWRSFIGMGFCF